jgi:aldose 1-epimerase
MQCPKCKAIASDGAKFCPKCGFALASGAPAATGYPAAANFGQPAQPQGQPLYPDVTEPSGFDTGAYDPFVYDGMSQSESFANPYDHNFVLCDKAGELRFAAEYHDPASGRTMTVYTDLPAIQLYTAVGMDGPTLFKGGVPQRCLHALCLETQFSPNTPNRPYMPQCFLAADGKYDSVTKFVFGTK